MDLNKSPHAISVDGFIYPGNFMSKARIGEINCMETTEKDIILTGYPRCGSTWMLEVLYLLQNDDNFEGAKSTHMIDRRYFIDITRPEVGSKTSADPFIEASAKLGQKRLLKTHLSAIHLTKPINDAKAPIFVVIRNPKDCLVSYYEFHQKHKTLDPGFKRTFSEFLEMHAQKQLAYGDWFDFYNSFWKLKSKPNVHFIFYERATQDLKGTIRHLAKILGKTVAEDMVEKIYEYCSFRSTKQNKTVDVPFFNGTYIREGQVGNWKNIFTVEQSKRIDKMYREKIANVRLPVEYDLKATVPNARY